MVKKYPVLVLCGRDENKRELIRKLDPDNKYDVKALLPFLGKRVIDWQMEALLESPYVDELYLLGISEDMAKFDYPVNYVPIDLTSTMAEKILTGLNYLKSIGKESDLYVVSTSDTPGMTVEPINEFFKYIEDHPGYDYYQSGVPDKITQETFADHGRVVFRFTDAEVYGGEFNAFTEKAIVTGQKIMETIGGNRRQIDRSKKIKQKNTLKPVIWLILKHPRVWPILIKYLRKKAPLAGIEKFFDIISGLKCKAVIIEDAAFGMDMDLLEDYDRLAKYVSKMKNIPMNKETKKLSALQ